MTPAMVSPLSSAYIRWKPHYGHQNQPSFGFTFQEGPPPKTVACSPLIVLLLQMVVMILKDALHHSAPVLKQRVLRFCT